MESDQWNQWIKDAKCLYLSYTVYSKSQYEILYLQSAKKSVTTYRNVSSINNPISYFLNTTCIRDNLLTTPVFINITILPCPPGFYLPENQSHPHCDCYPILIRNSFDCKIIGYISWNSTMWVNATFIGSKGGGIIYNQFCPADYCKVGRKTLSLGENPNAQCAFNRLRQLCCSCKENYSVAIGSSKCIKCIDNNHIALFFILQPLVFYLSSLSS